MNEQGMNEQVKQYTLDCDIPPKDENTKAACQELENFSDQDQKLADQHCVCFDLYSPVTLVIEGLVKSRPFLFSHTFSNACVFGCMTTSIRHIR